MDRRLGLAPTPGDLAIGSRSGQSAISMRRVVLRRAPGVGFVASAYLLGSVLKAPRKRVLWIALRTRLRGHCTVAIIHAELAELWTERLYACGLSATSERA